MIKFIHNNKRAIGIVFLIIAVCFMISGVGVDILHDGPSRTRDAALVNGKKFSYVDFERQQRRIADNYRDMFGPNFESLARSLNLNIPQQAIDMLINGELLSQKATELGFTADEDSVKRHIQTELFNQTKTPGGFNPDAFRSYLQGKGLTYKQYSAQVKDDQTRAALIQLIRDTAVTTQQDVESRYQKQETKYSLITAEISAAKLSSEVATPSDEELQRHYEANATDYEVPARVAYDYIVLDPKDFQKEVQVQPEDVEFFYTENASRYATPEKARVRSIKILFPKEEDPAKMAAASERANKAHEEALQGTPFQQLVTKYSDDIPSKLSGGDRGWIVRGKGEPAFDSAVFATEVGGISEVIKLDYGFEVVKVEEKQAAGTQTLDEVREAIAQELRATEAPSYAAAKGHDLVAEVKKSGKSLKEVAQTLKISVLSTNGLVAAASDPAPTLKGLTAQVLGLAGGDRLAATAFDVGALTVVAQARDFREPSTLPFDEVKTRIAATLKEIAVTKLAEQRAQELLTAVKANPANFKKEAEARKAKVSGTIEISRAGSGDKEAQNLAPILRSAALRLSSPAALDAPYPSQDGYTVAVVTKITKPSAAPSASDLAKYREQSEQENSTAALESVVGMLKASAELDIDDQLLLAQ